MIDFLHWLNPFGTGQKTCSEMVGISTIFLITLIGCVILVELRPEIRDKMKDKNGS